MSWGSVDERIAAKTDKTETCWLWTGERDPQGYAHIRCDGQRLRVHRYVLAKKLGRPIEPGMYACHTCDRPECIRPEHLFEGTQRDNIRDALAKGRMRWQKAAA